MINKTQYKELRETYNNVIIPKVRRENFKIQVEDLWLAKTSYDKVVFAHPICGYKEFPQTFIEIGQVNKLSHNQIDYLYFTLKRKNLL